MAVLCGDCGSAMRLEWERHRLSSKCFRVCDHCGTRISQTVSRRMNSSKPNLQNIPIRTEEGRRIREAFLPPKRVLVEADYADLEARIRYTGGGIIACHTCGNDFSECSC